jgi:hypothetical protein
MRRGSTLPGPRQVGVLAHSCVHRYRRVCDARSAGTRPDGRSAHGTWIWWPYPGSLWAISAAPPRNSTLGLGTQWLTAYARFGRRAVELALSRENRIEQCVPMAKFDSPYDRVRKLPKQFKPLRAYEEERRRGVAHTPEYDEQMRVLKEEFQRWLLAE